MSPVNAQPDPVILTCHVMSIMPTQSGRRTAPRERLTYARSRRRLKYMATDTRQTDDTLTELLVEATGVAQLAARLRDHIVARNIELPADLADWLLTLAADAAHLRDAVHHAGLDPSDDTAIPRFPR